ncbi:MAG: hypothetical protein NW220_04720 [Leptolyngbyaceae cyanobacterium bins.349]|nr:hypothetical protein [Leptolyngbyaceae cyanobacterium bins.349]
MMKLKTFVALGLLGAIAAASPVLAQETLIAFPGININITPGGSGNSGGSSGSERLPASNDTSFKGFSGQYSEYADTYNGFKIKVPAEFNLTDKGMTTNWNGPLMDGGSALIYINAAPLKGVPSKTAYEINLKSKKEDRNYTEVVPVTVKMGNKTAYAFRCKEAPNKPGTPDTKAPTDHHRWHLMVFGNETVYTLGFTGPFASFQSNKLQPTYETVINSVELMPLAKR